VTVLLTSRVDTRPYAGYDDPSLPIASYIGQAAVAGNATGGIVVITFPFQIAEALRVTELFNLEQYACETNNGVSEQVVIRTVQMDSLVSNIRPLVEQRWVSNCIGAGNGVSATVVQDLGGMPIWLGAPSSQGFDAGLSFQFTNVDLRIYVVTVMGWMWGPRSILAPGGPQRPPFGYLGR